MLYYMLSFVGYTGYVYVSLFSFVSVFFFFKQKTAYEMRISDWSSDVCSSDLDTNVARADVDVPAGDIGVGGREIGYMFGQYKRKIGRASCRERVCQYV